MPELMTFSWLRSYHLGLNPAACPADLIQTLLPEGSEEIPPVAHRFYDIQALRRRHVARYRLPGLTLEIPCRDEDVLGGLVASGRAHVVFHGSGFLTIRLTLTEFSLPVDDLRQILSALHRRMFSTGAPMVWRTPWLNSPAESSVRPIMNTLFASIYERWRGRSPGSESLLENSVEGSDGASYLHALAADPREPMNYPYPVSYGTTTEFDWDPANMPDPLQWAQPLLAWDEDDHYRPLDIDNDAPSVCWALRENRSVLFRQHCSVDASLDTVDPDRLQLVEFLNLRAAALSSIQRQTQLLLTEEGEVHRDQISEWQRLLVTTTDDWVLHVRIGSLMECATRALDRDPRARDIGRLEQQVISNVSTFRERVDVAGARAGIVLGVLFGIVAALSLSPILKRITTEAIGTSAQGFEDDYWALSIGIDVFVVAAVGIAALLWFNRISSRIPASSARR